MQGRLGNVPDLAVTCKGRGHKSSRVCELSQPPVPSAGAGAQRSCSDLSGDKCSTGKRERTLSDTLVCHDAVPEALGFSGLTVPLAESIEGQASRVTVS